MIKSLLKHFMCAAQVLDEYTDKLYEQFVSEGGQLARQSVKVSPALCLHYNNGSSWMFSCLPGREAEAAAG